MPALRTVTQLQVIYISTVYTFKKRKLALFFVFVCFLFFVFSVEKENNKTIWNHGNKIQMKQKGFLS